MSKQRTYEISLDISSNSKLSAKQTTSRLLLEYVQLILYLRSQIPEPVQLMCKKFSKNQIVSTTSSSNHEKLKGSEVQYNKKCIQLLKHLDDLKKNIDILLNQSAEFEAVVAIGSTPVSTKEAFTFQVGIKDDLDKKEVYNIDSINSHARKFCMMMVQSSLCSSDNLSPTNTRLFLRSKNIQSSDGCRPWPNLRWPPKKHLLHAEVNFHASKPVNDSLVASTDDLSIKSQEKENCDPYETEEQVLTRFTDSEVELGKESRLVRDQNPKATRPKRLTATEAAEALLAEDGTSGRVESSLSAGACSDKDSECNYGTWLELPVVMKGFRI